MDSEMIILISLYTIVMVTAGLGNLLIIISTIRSSSLRSCTNILICNLAVSDFIIATCSLPLQIYGLLETLQSLWLCKFKVFLAVFLFSVSNMNVVLISFDRFLGVNWPLQYKTKASTFKLKIAITSSWIISFLLGSFPLVVVGDKTASEIQLHSSLCNYVGLLHPAYITFLEFGTFLLAWITIIFLYLVICKKLYQSRKNPLRLKGKVYNNANEDASEQQRNIVKFLIREIKYAKVVCISVAVYTFFLTPIVTVRILRNLSPSYLVEVDLVTFKAILLLLYSSAILNPLIYGITMQKYRNEFKKIFFTLLKIKLQ